MNKKISKRLNELVFLMSLDGANQFQLRAFQKAALLIEGFQQDVRNISNIQDVKGIGKSTAKVIQQLVDSEGDTCERLEELYQRWPKTCIDLLRIQGIGPAKARMLIEKGYKSLAELKEHLEGKLIGDIPESVYKLIQNGLDYAMIKKSRIPWPHVDNIVYKIKEFCKQEFPFRIDRGEYFWIEATGSYRRLRDDCRDVDFVISSNVCTSQEFFERIKEMPGYENTHSAKDTKAITRIDGEQVDFLFVPPNQFGATVLFYTGSKQLNIHMATIAQKKGMELKRFEGLDRGGNGPMVTKESEIFRELGMPFLLPEHREDHFLDVSPFTYEKFKQQMVTVEDIKGDLHLHSTYSDGNNTIEEIVAVASRLSYNYIGITDHSEGLKIANGMTRNDVVQRFEDLKKFRNDDGVIRIRDVNVLLGVECEIDSKGELDYDQEFRERFDYVIAAAHRNHGDHTERLLKAIKDPTVKILAHPTARIYPGQWKAAGVPARETDWDSLFKAASKHNVILEVNCQPDRLDLPSDLIIRALKLGCRFVCNTDSHSIDTLHYINYGVNLLRRAGVPKKLIVNTYSFNELIKVLK